MPTDLKGLRRGVLFGKECKEKASEPEGSEAVIPVISLVALLCGDVKTASDDTRQY